MDAQAIHPSFSWTEVSDLEVEPRIIVSIGFAIPDLDPGHIVLAQSCDVSNDTVDHVIGIPMNMVLSIEKVLTTQLLPVEKPSL
jgi:hypothetical protein